MHKICIFLSLLFVCDAFADDLFSTSVVDGCSVDMLGFTDPVSINAVFEPKTITCSSGYFLPANNINCEACSNEANCVSGTWTFNETKSHGIVLNNTFSQNQSKSCDNNLLGISDTVSINAVFRPKNITCSAGYYLPANIDECTKCLNDHYCPGGTYTFNETVDQGITACPPAHQFAPAGMWQQSQCGRKLHLGNDVLYMHQTPAHPTQHRLFIGYINGINYSANAVAKVVGGNNPKMSAGASNGLHVMIDNVEYLICDDSVCPNTPQE